MASSGIDVRVRRDAALPATSLPDAGSWRRSLLRARRVIGSVRFGIILLGLLLVCCMLGMIIMQQEMPGFAEYYASLSPAQKKVYGALGLFDVYGSWYFATLLVLTGLSIVVSSVTRFPTAWRFVRRPKLQASRHYLSKQAAYREVEASDAPAEVVGRVVAAWRAKGFTPRVTERGGRTTVFAERHAWNRLGAYVVHVALLMIFFGGFLTSQFAVSGILVIEPGTSTDTFVSFEQRLDKQEAKELRLPFRVECTDIQQQLIDPAGGLDPSNTVDWLSRVRIADAGGATDALIHLNEPLDHRGYRFFQSSFEPEGSARTVTLKLESVATGARREVTVGRDGADVEGVGRLDLVRFYPDFHIAGGQPTTRSGEYNNPVAQLQLTTADGRSRPVFAFGAEMAKALGAAGHGHGGALALVGTESISLASFEKVARSHMLRVQYDPGKTLVYVGFTLLCLVLALVFSFAHERYWALVEPAEAGSRVSLGGNTNRNPVALRGRFAALADTVVKSGSQS